MKIPTGHYTTGKIKFVAKGSGLIARVFWIRTDKLKDPAQIFGLPRATPEPDPTKSPWARTTAFFRYDNRTAVIDVNVTKSVYFGGLDNNPGEYEKGLNVLGNPYLRGNYGITYEIFLKNAKGKKIKITPNLFDKKAQIVLWEPSKGWYRTSLITTSSQTKYWLIDVAPEAYFKYVLPSFNCGNIVFEFEDFKS